MSVLRKTAQIILLDDEEQQFAFWITSAGVVLVSLPAYRLPRAVLGDDGRIYVRTNDPQAGQLAAAKATLHTGKAGAHSYVEQVHLYNSGAGDNTVKLYVTRDGGSSRCVFRGVLKTLERLEDEKVYTFLNPGELLEGEATNASEVNYDFNVREETPI